jgi:hypothetical protein
MEERRQALECALESLTSRAEAIAAGRAPGGVPSAE